MASRWTSVPFVLLLSAVLMAVLSPPASAQGFLDRLFGPRYYSPQPPARGGPAPSPYYQYNYQYNPYGRYPPPPAYLPPRAPNDRPQARAPSEAPLPKVTTVDKNPDAATILVIGDFLGAALADGLNTTLADEPRFTVVDKTNGGSGLVRNDFYDWEKQLPDILNKTKPAFVVFMIGTNDRQPLRTSATGREAVRSDAWEAAVKKRIDGILQTARTYGRPFYWVGLPPMSNAAAAADMAYFNGLYKAGVESVGGTFIDVWNGFADETGKYAARTPDADGQVRTMRAGDGINLTKAGEIKLAYYVDREIRKKGGPGAPTLATSATSDEKIEIGPRGERWLVGPVISLTDPPPGSGGKLAGESAPGTPAESSVQYKVVVEGATAAAVAGRVDDNSWPPMKADFGAPVVATAAPTSNGTTVTVPLATSSAAGTNAAAGSGGTPAANTGGGQGTRTATTQGGAAATNRPAGSQSNAATNNRQPPPPPQPPNQGFVGPVPPALIPGR